jgi:hypothetical protein
MNEAAVTDIVTLIGDLEAKSESPFNRFTDTTAIETIDLKFKYVFDIALLRRLSYVGRPPVKSAILVPSRDSAHYSKMHELLTRYSSIEVRIFEEREAAAKWLGVPVEFLNFSPIGS